MKTWRHPWVRVTTFLLAAITLASLPIGFDLYPLFAKLVSIGAALGAAIGTIWGRGYYGALAGSAVAILGIRAVIAMHP